MELIVITCPKCGGHVHIEDGAEKCFCSYCGAQLLLDDGNTTHTVSYRDEARIREADIQEQIALKKLEAAESQRQDRKKVLKVAAIAAGALFVVALIAGLFDWVAGMLLGEVALLVIFLAFAFTMPSNEKADEDGSRESAREREPAKNNTLSALGGVAAALGAVALLIRPWRR